MSTAPAMSERQFEDAVVELAKRYGWRVKVSPTTPMRGGWGTPVKAHGRGFPDFLALRGPRLVVAELKAGKNKLTKEQAAWLDAWDAFAWSVEKAVVPFESWYEPHPWVTVVEWRPEDFPDAISEVLR